ncbi:MAG TPA: response regulator [Polyangiaceae bacterium]|nr:response regulator [Polyangiaceae bacterium]
MADNKTPVVLVADDEPSMLALVAAFVRSKGYTVIEASDGDMAWQMATARLPDLIILDVMMPGMSGWEVCRKIREAVSLAHTGVIMLTGIGESLNEMTSPLYGADAYVDKPFELGDLERSIVETLRKRREGAIGRNDDASSNDDRATIRSPAFDGLPAVAKKAAKAAPAIKKSAIKKAAGTQHAAPKKAAPAKPAKKAAPAKSAKKGAAKKATAKKPVAKKAAAKKPAATKIKKAPKPKARSTRPRSLTAAKKNAAKGAKKPAKKAAKKRR